MPQQNSRGSLPAHPRQSIEELRAYKAQWMRDKRSEPGGRDYDRRYWRENNRAKHLCAKFRKCGVKLSIPQARRILNERAGRQLLIRGIGTAFRGRLAYWSSVLELRPLGVALLESVLRLTSSPPQE